MPADRRPADSSRAGRSSSRRRRGEGPRDRRREDRLSAGHAGDGPRPRGRPRRRHGEAGGDVRGGARGLRHRAPGEPEAPRLPDARARRAVRLRLPAGPEARGGACSRPQGPAGRFRGTPAGAADARQPHPAAPSVDEPGRAEGARDRGGEDRLPAGHAGDGPRPRGRSRRRHREAGGDVRGGARGLRHRAPGEPEAPRLPDARARRAVRLRLPAGPEAGGSACRSLRGPRSAVPRNPPAGRGFSSPVRTELARDDEPAPVARQAAAPRTTWRTRS